MGCFLTITSRDLAQLSATMKASVNIVSSSGGNEVKIQVNPTLFNSAREMAKQIRRQAKTAQVTTGSSQEAKNAVPMKQRMQYQIAALSQISPALTNAYLHNVRETYKGEMRRFGKVDAEPIAAEILKQENYLDGAKEVTITRSTGIDIVGSTKTNTNVVIEVKFSTQEKDFGKMMSTGAYADETSPQGHRQMSDGWLNAVSKVDSATTKILGVHINPERETVTIYRRMDSEAKQWKPLVTKPLSDFNLKSFG
jgi:hypothetical protein